MIEALNDYLLALRFLLEGGGPADLGLSMRVAALCAEPERRGEVKAVVDRAIGLERELWSGEPAPGATRRRPAETAAALEDLARAILKDAAAGHLGSDLRVDRRRDPARRRPRRRRRRRRAARRDDRVGPRAGRRGRRRARAARTELDRLRSRSRCRARARGRLPDYEPEPEEVSELDERISPEDDHEPEEETMIERAREIFGDHVDVRRADDLARARPGTGEPESSTGATPASYEDESQRLVDDEGRPRPGEPGAAPDRAAPAPSARRATTASPASSRGPRRRSGTCARSPTTAAGGRASLPETSSDHPQEEQVEPPGPTPGGFGLSAVGPEA